MEGFTSHAFLYIPKYTDKMFWLMIFDKIKPQPGDMGPIPGRVIPKTFKMVLDSSLLNTQQYKVMYQG